MLVCLKYRELYVSSRYLFPGLAVITYFSAAEDKNYVQPFPFRMLSSKQLPRHRPDSANGLLEQQSTSKKISQHLSKTQW